MIISLIAALDRNRVIGKNNSLPWHLPGDLKRFKKLTEGKAVIMGRKTYESIGRPLPNRLNIVLTQNKDLIAPGITVAHSKEEALEKAAGYEEVFIIGGEGVFKEFMPLAQKMYLTFIDHSFVGDVYFPDFNPQEWREIKKEVFPADAKNPYACEVITLERI